MMTRTGTGTASRPLSLRDAGAFEAFYRQHARQLLVFLTRRTLDAHLALELTAETFAQAFERRGQFRGGGEEQATAWLYRIASNQHAKYLRRGKVERRAMQRLGLSLPDYNDVDIQRVDELAESGSLRARVAAEFGGLPGTHREAVRLRIVEDLPYPRVAEHLGISEPAARARVSRGLRLLRDNVRSHCEESPT